MAGFWFLEVNSEKNKIGELHKVGKKQVGISANGKRLGAVIKKD